MEKQGNDLRTWRSAWAGIAGLLLVVGAASCNSGTGDLAIVEQPRSSAPVSQRALPPELPTFGPEAAAPGPPPPISGGTLLITADDATAVAADPDRDSVWLVDLAKQTVRKRVRLAPGAEPGRIVEDHAGLLHVALRRGGAVATIDPQAGAVMFTRAVCKAPRGLAYDAGTDNLHVACAGGELVTLPARGGAVTRTLLLDNDLRDVVVQGDHLLISRFRTAELLEVDASGALVGRAKPRSALVDSLLNAQGKPSTTSPNTAWRLVGLPGGQVAMLHQRASDEAVSIVVRGGYGSQPSSSAVCQVAGIVNSSLTLFSGAANDGPTSPVGGGAILNQAALAVDVAASRDGQQLAWISVSDQDGHFLVGVVRAGALTTTDPCVFSTGVTTPLALDNQLIAGAYDSTGQLYLQARNPARIYLYGSNQFIDFVGAEDRSDAGHQLFHQPTSAMVACASCHAEAGDDSHLWSFDPIGLRRTPSLRGGLLATAPFHWDGTLATFSAVMDEVFTKRMNGAQLTPDQANAVAQWVDAQPALPTSAPADPAAVARGLALFNDSQVGCASCHSGAHFTNNRNEDVNTGGKFQVPSLIGVAYRAPYLHNGCAATLRDRFTAPCSDGDSHGKTAQLATGQIDDLVAYLATL